VRAHGLTERRIVGQSRLVERLHVELREPLPLLLRDLKAPVNIDQVLEAEFAAEAIGPTERLGGEPGQVVDVMGLPGREQALQQGIGEHLVVEELLQSVQRLIAAGEFVEGSHGSF
jgi:hypothetical protein